MRTLRMKKTETAYQQARSSGKLKHLRDEPALMEFKYFTIIDNKFPHDRIASTHHLLVPKRLITHWAQMNIRERREFTKIDDYCATIYDSIKMNYPSFISVPEIVHWHLYKYRDDL